MLPPTPIQLYLVSIRFRRKISFVRLLLFLIDLKSTIQSSEELYKKKSSNKFLQYEELYANVLISCMYHFVCIKENDCLHFDSEIF